MSDIKQTLGQIIVSKQEAIAMLLELEGEVTPEVESFLDKVERDLEHKVDAYAAVENELELQADYFREMARQFAAKAKQAEQMREHLRSRIKLAMQNLGVAEMNGVVNRYALATAKPKIVIDGALPDQYEKLVTPEPYYEADRTRIEEDLKAGIEIPGCRLEPVYSLRTSLAKPPRLKGNK